MAEEKHSRLGTYVSTITAGETVRAFVPPPLPPDPPVDLSGLYQQLDRANQALGRLDGLTTLLPDARLFLYLYVRKEALLSSQIEGAKSSFSDLLLFENEAVPGVPIDDVEEVSNYVAARLLNSWTPNGRVSSHQGPITDWIGNRTRENGVQ
jgi:Fic family protein